MISHCRKCGGRGMLHSYLSGAILVYYVKCDKCFASTKHEMSRDAKEARQEVETCWNNGFIR